MKKIEKMTVQQEKDLVETRNKWLQIGRATHTINREKAKSIIFRFYEKIGKKHPLVFFFQSPMMCIEAYLLLSNMSKQKEEIDLNKLKKIALNQLNGYFPGQHWCAWEVYYDFARRLGLQYKPEENELLDLWLEQSRELHWWFPYENICLVSERHNIVGLDDLGRPHCDTGLAIGYPDGWGFYAIHGVRVPEKVVLAPEKLSPKEILEEQNAEVRRVMMSRYGESKLLQEAKAKILDEDQDSSGLRTLFWLEVAGDEPLVMVRVHCVRKDKLVETYFLRVPPETKTCKEAVAWSFGKNVKDYAPTAES